jgi:tungstate transport system substrate-binding protein
MELRWVATGTGKALRLGQNCDADILMVHAPSAEKKFVASGFGKDRTEVMYNDFVIVGPAADPAELRGLSVTRTMQTIQERAVVFVSRGDNSGTNKKEMSLWRAAGLTLPDKEQWYLQTGQGMLATLNVAAERNGYTMTDRGTYIKYEANMKGNPALVILVEGDPVLLNQYSVIAIDPTHCSNARYEKATAFIDWVTASEAQREIGKFRLLGKQLFTPNAR